MMREQYKALIQKVGTGFHPDTPMDQYTYWRPDGQHHGYFQSFVGKELQEMQYLLHELWDFYGMTIYEVGLELMKELFPDDHELLYGEDDVC
jgi:hypothetical protein